MTVDKLLSKASADCTPEEVLQLQVLVADLRDSLVDAKRDLESGFMVGAYARLKDLQEIERKYYALKQDRPDTTALPYAEVKRRLEGLTRAAWRVMHHWNIFKEPSLKEVMAELSYAVQDADAQMPAQTEGDNLGKG